MYEIPSSLYEMTRGDTFRKKSLRVDFLLDQRRYVSALANFEQTALFAPWASGLTDVAAV